MDSFTDIVKTVWSCSDNLMLTNFYDNYNKFKSNAIRWKKTVFGHLDNKVLNIENQLARSYDDIENSYSKAKHFSLKELKCEHRFLLQQKEWYWKLRARNQWLKEGDNNTKFYHAFATAQKRRNLIQSIKIGNIWLYEVDEINNIFVHHFKNLYTSNRNNNFSFEEC